MHIVGRLSGKHGRLFHCEHGFLLSKVQGRLYRSLPMGQVANGWNLRYRSTPYFAGGENRRDGVDGPSAHGLWRSGDEAK